MKHKIFFSSIACCLLFSSLHSQLIPVTGPPPVTISCAPAGGNIPAPTWGALPGPDYGTFYTGKPCPVRIGIGTDSPRATIEVKGNGRLSSLGINTNPKNKHKINLVQPMSSVNASGIYVKLSNANSKATAYKVETKSEQVKGFTLFNSVENKNVFEVLGDGNTHTTKLSVNSKGTSGSAITVINDDFPTKKEVFKVLANGTVWSTEVNVKLRTDFPDYVFKKDYQLLSLTDLEGFILSNGHLPNIPKAEEVAKTGLNLGELQVKQMEKIEELTLYTIQQQKVIDALLKRVEELEEKLNN